MGLLFNKKILTSDELKIIPSYLNNPKLRKVVNGYQKVRNDATTWFDIHKIEELKPIINKLLKNIPGEVTYYGFHAIEYNSRSYASPHRDTFEWTMLTLLDGEWEGGELVLEEDIVDFPIGNTICFDKTTLHGVQPIVSGKRTVLVAWVNKIEKK